MQYPQKLLALSLVIATSQIHAAPPVHQYEYDANGNPTKVTNGLNHATKQKYDPLNRPILIEQPHATASGQQGTIQTQYNIMNQVVNVTDPRALPTTYTKNAFGEIVSQTSPDTGTTSFTYDNAGNILTRTDARGAIVTNTYDYASRITSATYKPSAVLSADETVQFSYDAGGYYDYGKLVSVNNTTSNLIFEYDPQGRVWYKRQIINGHFLDYLYYRSNNSGRLLSFAYSTNPTGANVISYEHNANAQIDKIAVNGQLILQNVLYYPDGSVASWEWGNGQVYDRFNDTSGRVVRYSVGDKLQNLIYDNAGRIQQTYRSLVATPNTPINNSIVNYNYDNLDRITGNTTTSTTHGYSYDLTGNRTSLAIGGNSYPYTIATNSNRLMAEAGPTARSNTYDNAGNLTSNGQDTYSYYASGRLKQVTRNGTVIARYKYNGLGELVQKTNISNVSTYYLYNNEHHLVGEYNQQGQAIQTYIYLGDIPVAVIKNGAGTIQDNLFYIYTDHLNTPREIRNHANQQRWTWYPETAEAFGANLPDDNPQGLGAFNFNVRFPGQLYDPITQLSYNYYRDYNPRTGRYTTSDPIGLEGGINTYAYVGGNPTSNIDPNGLDCISVGGRTTCSYPGKGGPSFTVPSTTGFPASLPSDGWLSHQYDVKVPLDGADMKCVLKALQKNPTPGLSSGASPQGILNDAVPIRGLHNVVNSYTTNDAANGNPLVVNMTTQGGTLADGYVARGITGGYVHTWGEGNSPLQSPLITGHRLQNGLNDYVWGSQMREIVEKCKCQK